jgi:hypothetical protein
VLFRCCVLWHGSLSGLLLASSFLECGRLCRPLIDGADPSSMIRVIRTG